MRVPQFEFSIRVCQPSREFGERHPVCVSAVDRPTRLRPIPRTALADTAADRKQRPYIVALAAGRYWPGPKVAGELTFTPEHGSEDKAARACARSYTYPFLGTLFRVTGVMA